ncbi:hypothetical protein V1478_015393 [Vespula squamosa]|uniref:Uncharacterized protein n=1 Tax=Vespula squamosa TaxID=30214 RepID=A0ABD2A504_VESSQ
MSIAFQPSSSSSIEEGGGVGGGAGGAGEGGGGGGGGGGGRRGCSGSVDRNEACFTKKKVKIGILRTFRNRRKMNGVRRTAIDAFDAKEQNDVTSVRLTSLSRRLNVIACFQNNRCPLDSSVVFISGEDLDVTVPKRKKAYSPASPFSDGTRRPPMTHYHITRSRTVVTWTAKCLPAKPKGTSS